MGFFSARRSEDYEQPLKEDKSVVKVIRSRFYGNKAAKARLPANESTPQGHSHPTTRISDRAVSSPSSTNNIRPGLERRSASEGSPNPAISRGSTDAVTITLAQRLNELAVANSEGLLNDDEYRLLRQSLFDRFAAGSTVPTETPLVPMAVVATSPNRGPSSPSHPRRPSSNYNTQSSRSSIQSNRSISSTVTGLLKRATSSRRRSSMAVDPSSRSDTMSVYSYTSTATQNTQKSSFLRRLTKQNSEFSLRPNDSQGSEYGNLFSPPLDISLSVPFSESVSRSTTRSIRRGKAPPSAFSGRNLGGIEVRNPHSAAVDDDEDQPQSAKDIRHEIELVEAERRRLLDAFNGLELSTMVRQQGRGSQLLHPLSSPVDSDDGIRTLHIGAEATSIRSTMVMDIDSTSLRSTGSMHTTHSMRKASITKAASQRPLWPPLDSSSIHRKASTSTLSSVGKPTSPLSSPLAPRSSGRLRLGASTSSVNLARSTGHLPLATVAETDTAARSSSPISAHGTVSGGSPSRRVTSQDGAEDEMVDIRKRRAEVTARYDARLEYLRARLKGAELREKLLKA
ncbi:hypothetical protein C8Q75DRAFT_809376 [Abortiporus biennis]|nr:hypothetical protein C8Q75DRAFT_809376 [Abortiporus biennis]